MADTVRSNPWTAALVLVGAMSIAIGGIVLIATYDTRIDPGLTGVRLTGILLVSFGMLNLMGWMVASAITWREPGPETTPTG